MVRIRTTNEIILSAIDFYRIAQPLLDTKPGTVARDLLIDGPSAQLARLYEELSRIRNAQSLRLSLGVDLDRLANNFGASRKQGSKATGIGLFTFSSIDADIPINAGDIVTANNGATFQVVNSLTVSPVFANTFRAIASQYKSDLDFVGITDQYAVEVQLEATATGTIGNISKYALTTTSTAGVSNVTNAQAFGGGSSVEDDAAFRNRVLAIFSGANTGTALGYQNAVLADPAVLDAVVIVPGDPLMTRDGTQVVVSENGTRTIIQDGTGGKVDIYTFGIRLVEILDSFIYRDQSNRDDPTDPSNDFVLGQIAADDGKTVTRKRIDDLANGVLPDQPVNDIIQVSGSESGPNFVEKTTDSLGRVSGNYELIRDTGEFAGSPWGFDRLHWISDRISGLPEDLTKGRFNGQDPLTYSDVLKISSIKQNLQVINENSRVSSSDRTSIQLSHTPVSAVTRVFNLTTGERYVVANQNPDGTGSLNETGRIVISGQTLPATSDTLQVDYTWVFEYDPSFDFDNRTTNTNPRSVLDSVDWGFSNAVRRERQNVVMSGSLFTVTVTHPISAVVEVNTFTSESATVQLISNRLAVVVSGAVSNVVSVQRTTDGAELYETSRFDGSFSGLTIFLPTDTVGEVGDTVDVVYNASDVFTVAGISGSYDGNVITLSSSASVSAGTTVECSYISNVRTLLPTTILSSLPAIRDDNAFRTTAASNLGSQPTTHVFSSPGVIEQNLRQAPTRLGVSISGTITTGVITVTGTTFTGVFDSVFVVANAGLKHNLASIIKKQLGLTSAQTVPSTVSIVRVISVEKVTATDSFDVLSVDHTYDVKGYRLKSNNFVKSEAVQDSALLSTEFELPATGDNISNAPNTGDYLRVTFYISKSSDSENVSFSKAGTLYTDKIFALVDTVAISSGFTSSAALSSSLTISNQNQPANGTRYTTSYDYLAPKTNERITIRYNQNHLIIDSTLAVENVRPISADVLVKAAVPILVNVEMAIVVTDGFTNASEIVKQNVRDAITTALNATALGTTLDESDLINVAYTVDGVDRVRPIGFNVNGETGHVLSISAEKNEYIQANTVTITVETR